MRAITELTLEQLATVRATLPTVAGAIDDIAVDFYRRLFVAHPELERDLFDREHQRQGRQQRALAGAVAVYASALVDPDAPDPSGMMQRVAHRHAALGIRPAQYDVVYEHLFGAIGTALGDAATPPIVDAWSAVYWRMAGELAAAEQALYTGAGVASGDVWRSVRVLAVERTVADVLTLTLGSDHGGPLPSFAPGQYVSVQIELEDGARQIRQYSLNGPDDGTWRISVRDAAPRNGHTDGVSSRLHAVVVAGTVLRASLPFGHLALDESDRPLLLVSAGIGCTPMLGILHRLVRDGSTRPVLVVHAEQSATRHAHRDELSRLVAALPNARLAVSYEDVAGRVDLRAARPDPASTARLCGPVGFMAAMRVGLLELGLDDGAIQQEVFGATVPGA